MTVLSVASCFDVIVGNESVQFALSVFAGAGVNMWVFVNFESYFLFFYLFFLSGDFS